MVRKFYISGKISNLPESSWNYNFKKCKELVQFEYHESIIVNPAEGIFPCNGKDTWTGWMRSCLIELCDCTDIVMMRNWVTSKGAWVELLLAKILGLRVHWSKVKLKGRKG